MLKLIHVLDMDFNNVLDYYNSFNYLKETGSYAVWLVGLGKDEYINYIKENKENLYYLVDLDKENYILGTGIININDSDYGNIGCVIRENERNKGYGEKLFKLLLLKSKELGIKQVSVACYKDKETVNKIITNSNGILEKEWIESYSNKKALKYNIKL